MISAINDEASVAIDANRTLWLMEISHKTFVEQALDCLESDGGLFIALEDRFAGTFDVLAKAGSMQMGLNLLTIIAQSHARDAN